MTQPIRNYWTPRIVICTLAHYTALRADLESGLVAPGEEARGSAVWEAGNLVEKLACRLADIDRAMARLEPGLAHALRLYYLDPGYESYRAVGRAMRCSDHTARRRVQRAVSAVAERLCNSPKAGEEAVRLIQSFR